MIVSGDYMQTLPVVPWGTKADELLASLKASYLWNSVQKLHLKSNVRVIATGNLNAAQYAVLHNIGEWKFSIG